MATVHTHIGRDQSDLLGAIATAPKLLKVSANFDNN